MIEIVLGSLRKLISEIETGVFTDINGHLNDCWEEFSLREREAKTPPEVLLKNCKILEELIVAIQAYQAKSISIEKLHLIKSKLLEEK